MSVGGSLYCCAGVPSKSTKETSKDWNILLNRIQHALIDDLDRNGSHNQLAKLHLALAYDEIHTDYESPLLTFFENCRNAQMRNELEERFLHFYRF